MPIVTTQATMTRATAEAHATGHSRMAPSTLSAIPAVSGRPLRAAAIAASCSASSCQPVRVPRLAMHGHDAGPAPVRPRSVRVLSCSADVLSHPACRLPELDDRQRQALIGIELCDHYVGIAEQHLEQAFTQEDFDRRAGGGARG
jgi:hypothetical protein